MITRSRIIQEIKAQEKAEGPSRDTGLMLEVALLARTSQEWQCLARTVHVSYGRYSYQTRRFHYPSRLLLQLRDLMEDV